VLELIMNRYAFRIHHDSDPRRIGFVPMDSDAVHAALARFRDYLPAYLREIGACAEALQPIQRSSTAIRVTVHTMLDWQQAATAMVGYADRHGLRATHVTVGLAAAARRRTAGAVCETV
jgi:hypothetical protein